MREVPGRSSPSVPRTTGRTGRRVPTLRLATYVWTVVPSVSHSS